MRARALFFFLLVLSLGVFSSSSVHAASIPVLDSSFHIVPSAHDIDPSCAEGAPLSMGAVMEIIQRLLNAGISFAIVIFVIIFAWAGFLFISSVANPESKNLAKKMLMNAAVGLLIVLAAWLIVDFVMKTLYNPNDSGWGPWNSILRNGSACVVESKTARLFSGAITAADLSVTPLPGSTGGTAGTKGCPTCVSLSTYGLSCKSGCTLDPNVAPKMGKLKTAFNGSWIVTEAYPPSTNVHTNECHYNGTCIDAGFTSPTTYTVANVAAFSQAAGQAGLRAVFETSDCALRDAARAKGVSAYCKTDQFYTHITGTHFSVYGN